jgi:hypothetical protein
MTIKFSDAMKQTLLSACLVLLGHFAFTQNCGQVTNFTANAVNNGNGTSTYNFSVTIQATSGGSKSVRLTIACPEHVFISNQCEASNSTVRVVNYGPFTVSTCSSDVDLTWSGHSNATCGGTTCNPLQEFVQLPVELSVFSAKKQGAQAVLAWTTASEQDNEKFIVERSLDGTHFESIAELPGRGTTTSAQSYSFVDERPLHGTNLYRLKQLDFSGDFSYSEIVAVKMIKEGEILAYPTPFAERLTLDLPENLDSEENLLTIYNLHGQLVHQQLLQGSGSQQLELGGLNPGQYVLCLTSGAHTQRMSIIKQ